MIGKIKKALISSDKLFLLKPNDYYRFTNDIFIITFYRSIFNSFFRLFIMIVQNLTAFFYQPSKQQFSLPLILKFVII
ncbi:hypothetical protein QQ41_06095 [Streptococcus equi subsp. zooepidemicus]|nr:hypothetical protein QQ41_06095 [Streptococcus equi subsp. zooepidemicus]